MRLITAILGGLALYGYRTSPLPLDPISAQDVFGVYTILSMQIFTPSRQQDGPKRMGVRFGVFDQNPLAAPNHYGLCKAEFPMTGTGQIELWKRVSTVTRRSALLNPLGLCSFMLSDELPRSGLQVPLCFLPEHLQLPTERAA